MIEVIPGSLTLRNYYEMFSYHKIMEHWKWIFIYMQALRINYTNNTELTQKNIHFIHQFKQSCPKMCKINLLCYKISTLCTLGEGVKSYKWEGLQGLLGVLLDLDLEVVLRGICLLLHWEINLPYAFLYVGVSLKDLQK